MIKIIDKIKEAIIERLYLAIFDLISGTEPSVTTINKKIFIGIHIVIFLYNLYKLIFYRSILSAQMKSSLPYEHWFISIIPSICHVVFSLLILVFSLFAKVHLKPILKLITSICAITLVNYILLMIFSYLSISYYLKILLLTIACNISGILSILSYVSFS